MSSVIVAGATGAIGREFVVNAVDSDYFSRVVALTRDNITEDLWPGKFPGINIDKAHKKLQVQAIDWEMMCKHNISSTTTTQNPDEVKVLDGNAPGEESSVENNFPYSDTFSNHQFAAMCMGTTRSDAGGGEKFRRCDIDYVDSFARAVKKYSPGLLKFSQVSSKGANPTSYFLYMKTKGESDLKSFSKGFKEMSIFRPGLLDRNNKSRFNEKIWKFFMKPIPVKVVADAMIKDMMIGVTADSGKLASIGIPLTSNEKINLVAKDTEEVKDGGTLLANMARVYCNKDIYEIAGMTVSMKMPEDF